MTFADFNIRTSADIPPALARLRREFVVGLTEDMEALIELLSRLFPEGRIRVAFAAQMKAR